MAEESIGENLMYKVVTTDKVITVDNLYPKYDTDGAVEAFVYVGFESAVKTINAPDVVAIIAVIERDDTERFLRNNDESNPY